jgi:fatty-acyl-CoA synthase
MTQMLEGLMQNDFPLTLNHIRRRLRVCNAGSELVTLTADGSVRRATHPELGARIDRLARALGRLGVEQGDRVGTFAWNNQRHFELYFAVPCTGAVLHTLNIRLFEEQLTYIVNHAQDKVIFVDESLVAPLAELAPTFDCVANYVVMADGEGDRSLLEQLPNAVLYEDLLAASDAGAGEPFAYPELDERQAAALCYTSGTTGNPKGVLYSHRSISLHSSATLMTDANGSLAPTACWRSCPCSTQTPGGCPMALRLPALI